MAEIIQGLWIGRPLSVIERLSITSFLRHGHEYHLYCYEDLAGVPAGAIVKDGNAILPASEIFCYQQGEGRGSLSAFSNLFRYKLLLEKGGWWADTDTVCLRPFEFSEPVLLASEHTRTGARIVSGVIKLPAGHAAAALCYDVASKVDRATLKWGQTGPELVTRAAAQCGLLHLVARPEVFCPLPWWDWQTVLADDPQAAASHVTGNSYAIHLWHELWRRAGIAQAPSIPPTSFLARLLERFGVEGWEA